MNEVVLSRITGPLGTMPAAATEKGLCYLDFMEGDTDDPHVKILVRYFGKNIRKGRNSFIVEAEKQPSEYFSGKRRTFDIPLDVPGTAFQLEVWKVLMTIPYGERRSYKQQAEALGRPTAVRAVA